ASETGSAGARRGGLSRPPRRIAHASTVSSARARTARGGARERARRRADRRGIRRRRRETRTTIFAPWRVCLESSSRSGRLLQRLLGHRRRNVGHDLLGYRLGLGEQQEVIAAAGFRVGPAHVEAAERVPSDQSTGTLPVDVEVADVAVLLGALDM